MQRKKKDDLYDDDEQQQSIVYQRGIEDQAVIFGAARI